MPLYQGFKQDAQSQLTPVIALLLDEATGNEVALDLSYTTNKATSGDDTGLKLNKTDTASPGTSLLMDLQVGGTSQVTIDDAGQLRLDRGQTYGTGTGIAFGDADTMLYENADDDFILRVAGSNSWRYSSNQFYYSPSAAGPSIRGTGTTSTVPTLSPHRSSTTSGIGASESGTISLINSATETGRLTLGESNAFLHLYDDSYSGGTNYQRLEITGQTAGNFRIQTAAGGLGTAPDIEIDSKVILDPSGTFGTGTGLWFGSDTAIFENTSDQMMFRTGGTNRFYISGDTFRGKGTNGPILSAETPTSTNPTMSPGTDVTTGIGANAAGNISLICSATEIARVTSTQLDLQPSTELQMDMTTEDASFINFKATADADATSAISTLTTSGSVTHHIQVSINGTTAWIPCSTTDPS